MNNTLWLQNFDFTSFNPDTGASFQVIESGHDPGSSHTLYYNKPASSGRIALFSGDEVGCDLVLTAINRRLGAQSIADLVDDEIKIQENKRNKEADNGQ